MPYGPDFSANFVPVWNGSAWVPQKISESQVTAGTLTNASINAAAAIAYSKLALTGSVLNADLAGSIALSKLAQTVAVVYDRSTAGVDVNTSTTETSLYTKSITGGDMSTNRMLRLSMFGDVLHNNVAGDTVTWKFKFGGTTFFADTSSVSAATGAARQPWRADIRVANLGAANSQMIEGIWNYVVPGTAAPTTGIGDIQTGTTAAGEGAISTLGTIDTTTAQTLDITIQWSASSANNSFRLRYAVLELV